MLVAEDCPSHRAFECLLWGYQTLRVDILAAIYDPHRPVKPSAVCACRQYSAQVVVVKHKVENPFQLIFWEIRVFFQDWRGYLE